MRLTVIPSITYLLEVHDGGKLHRGFGDVADLPTRFHTNYIRFDNSNSLPDLPSDLPYGRWQQPLHADC